MTIENLQKGLFAVGDVEAYEGYYNTRQPLWNGWYHPYFTKEVCKLILNSRGINFREEDGALVLHVADEDTYVPVEADLKDYPLHDVEKYYPQQSEHGLLYSLGGGQWCWSLVNDEEDEEDDEDEPVMERSRFGAASIFVELRNDRITVTHGTDNVVLHEKDAEEDDWDMIWSAIRGNLLSDVLDKAMKTEEGRGEVIRILEAHGMYAETRSRIALHVFSEEDVLSLLTDRGYTHVITEKGETRPIADVFTSDLCWYILQQVDNNIDSEYGMNWESLMFEINDHCDNEGWKLKREEE